MDTAAIKDTKNRYNAIATVCIDHAAIRQLAAEGHSVKVIAKVVGLGYGATRAIVAGAYCGCIRHVLSCGCIVTPEGPCKHGN